MKEYEEKLNRSKTPPPIRKIGHNTGPKGVLADYYEDLERQKLIKQKEIEDKYNLMNKMTLGVKTDEESISYKSAHKKEVDLLFHSNDDDNSEEEDDFMEEYRKRRLAELQNNNLPIYGTLDIVTPKKLLEIIDDKNNQTFVIVHLLHRV